MISNSYDAIDNTLPTQIVEECCETPDIIPSESYMVCKNCGTTISSLYDYSGRAAYTSEEKKNRRINEKVYSPFGPRTVIRGSKDAKGNYLKPKLISKYDRLAKINRSLTNGYERNLWIALPHFNRMTTKLKAPEHVINAAFKIYQYVVRNKLTMGRNIDSLLAASMYASLRIHKIPRTMEEVLETAQISKHKLIRDYKMIVLKVLPVLKLNIKSFNSKMYIDKFGGELKVSMRLQKVASKLVLNAEKNGFVTSGKDPKGIAGGALYMSGKLCGEALTQKKICSVAEISEVTLRMRAKDLKKYNNRIVIKN